MSGANISIDKLPHVVIRASAGSGKTFQLSNRYLDLLHHDFKSDAILATTFTRKAAGEILERILRRLAQASMKEGDADELSKAISCAMPITLGRARSLLAQLCRSLHRVSVSTIDSFFNRIASSFRHELRLPLNPQMVDVTHPLAVQVRAAAIEAMLGDTDIDILIGLLKRLHHDSAQRRVTDAIDDIVTAMYETYRATRREDWHQLQAGNPLERDQVLALIAAMESLAESASDKRFAKAIRNAREAAQAGQWEDFLSGGLAGAIVANPDAPMYFKKPLAPEQIEAFVPLIHHARAALLGQLAGQTAATYDLLARFDHHYTKLRDQHRVLLYSDLPHKLARELPQRGDSLLMEICYRLDASVGHLLLDEFQDTSFEQWKVLGPFAEEIASYSDASRTFFCVGDIKQAIYGWRGGRAELFDRIVAELQLPQAAQVSLDVSFRSSQIVLDVVNKVFKSLPVSQAWKEDLDRGEATQWADGFIAHDASRKLPGHVEFLTSPAPAVDASEAYEKTDEETGDEPEMAAGHEQFVAQTIARLSREAKGRSIGVLVSRNEAVNSLIFTLRKLGVDASAEGSGPIVGDPAVDVVLAALRLADHPGHSAAAFHVLNSPLGPIVGLTNWRGTQCDRIAHAIRGDIFARGYAAVIADWARKLAPHCDGRSALKLTQLVELADRFEPGVTPRMREFIDVIEGSRIEDPSQSQVRVMTIHKSKGLEFDIVVLPELGSKMGRVGGKDAVTIERDPATDEVLAVHRATSKAVRALSPQLARAFEQQRMRRLRDDLCALYVAMTRARHALHLIAEPVKVNKSGSFSTKGVGDQSFAAVLRHALCDQVQSEDPKGEKCLYSLGNPRWHTAGSASALVATPSPVHPAPPALPPAAKHSSRTWRLVAPSSLHDSGHVRVADLLEVGVDQARQRGTLIHAWFELIGWINEPAGVPDEAALRAKAKKVLPVAMMTGEWIAQQIAEFRRMIAQPAVIASLSKPPLKMGEKAELWRERPFVVRQGDDLLRGSFDRVMVIHQDGKPARAEVIDFKSDDVKPSTIKLDERVVRYRPQLLAYRAAITSMLSLDVKHVSASLLMVAAGVKREII